MAAKSAISIDGQTFRPTLSVIIPAHNRAGGWLERALDSVLARTQVGVQCKVLVVDAGSRDAIPTRLPPCAA